MFFQGSERKLFSLRKGSFCLCQKVILLLGAPPPLYLQWGSAPVPHWELLQPPDPLPMQEGLWSPVPSTFKIPQQGIH